jgi:ATP-dependent DNA helicase PIF1
LNNVAGSTSYEHLRTVDGVLLPSFRERRGLIKEDNTLDECLTEATLFQMPSSLRRLCATILVFCELHDVMELWIKHYDAMSEDYNRNNPFLDLGQ